MTLRSKLGGRICAFTLLALAGGPALAQSAPPATAQYDVIITDGRIVDGTGNPWYSGDIAVSGGRIAKIGVLDGATARRTVDASGLVVTPGYIDLHSHSDMPLLADGTAQSKVRQGVTLDVLGESTSVAPRDGLPVTEDDGIKADWTSFTGYFDRLKSQGVSMNVISHAGFEQIRRVAVGYSPEPATPAQLEHMKRLMARSMEEGAWGMVLRFESEGPKFPDEVIALARIVRRYGGNIHSHIGSEGFEQDKEFDFTFRLAREADVRVHIFHLKARGTRNWPRMQHFLDRISDARKAGLDITANQYPYAAMQHGWSAFFPVWAREHGPATFAKILNDSAQRQRIKDDPDFKSWVHEHGGWEGIVYARASHVPHKQYEGKRVAELAKLLGHADPADTCIQLMAEAGGTIGGVFHAMSDENVKLVMKQPWVAIASDGGALNLQASGYPHPRSFGTAARVLGHYARDEKVISLEDAVRKMTSLPAQILGLPGRGQIAEGYAADIVILDEAKVADTATYEKPKSYPIGISYVLVNGEVVVDKGEHTGARPGQIVYGAGYRAAGAAPR